MVEVVQRARDEIAYAKLIVGNIDPRMARLYAARNVKSSAELETSMSALLARGQQSMSRRRNCHDNALAESIFRLLKRESVKRRTYATREERRADVFDYIEMFCNPKRRHNSSGGLSPINFEKQYSRRHQRVEDFRGDSVLAKHQSKALHKDQQIEKPPRSISIVNKKWPEVERRYPQFLKPTKDERLLRKVELRQHEAAVKMLTDQLEIEKARNAELTVTLHKITPISHTGTSKAES